MIAIGSVGLVEASEVQGLELEAEMRIYDSIKTSIGTTLAQIIATTVSLTHVRGYI